MSRVRTQNSLSPWEEGICQFEVNDRENRVNGERKKRLCTLQGTTSLRTSLERKNRISNQRVLVELRKINFVTRSKVDMTKKQKTNKMIRYYEGPRITFYSKMNPKCNKLTISHNQQYSKDKSKQSSHRLNHQTSQKILQVDKVERGRKENHEKTGVSRLQIKFSLNEDREGVKEEKDSNQAMKRLKFLYNCRKHKLM